MRYMLIYTDGTNIKTTVFNTIEEARSAMIEEYNNIVSSAFEFYINYSDAKAFTDDYDTHTWKIVEIE